MRKRELYSLIGSVIAPIVATAAAIFAFWWLTKYSTICERDIIGTAIIVWCAVLIRVLILAEKEEEA